MPIPKDILKNIEKGSFKEEFLNLRNQNIDDEEIIELVGALKKNFNIKIIDLSGNSIGDKGAAALSEVPLDGLSLRQNVVGSVGASKFANSRLRKLDISGNLIGYEGTKALAHCENILELGVEECEITNKGAKLLLKSKMKALNLSSNGLTDECLKDLPDNNTIETLQLEQNQFTNEGASFIAKNSSLRNVNLGSNKIDDKGARIIAEENHTIEELGLNQNRIGGEGFSKLCTSRNIKNLFLFRNKISFKKIDSLPSNDSFVKVSLSYNEVDDSNLEALQALISIPTLEELDIGYNKLTDKGVAILFAYRNKDLKEIDLNGNPIKNSKLINDGFNLKRSSPETGFTNINHIIKKPIRNSTNS